MSDRHPNLRVLPPPLYFILCLALAWGVHRWRPVALGIEYRIELWIAVVLMAIAATIGGLALGEMKRLKTPAEPWKRPVRLATGGPFRFSRNPIYISFFFILAAIGMLADSAWIVGSVVVLWIVLDRFVVRREEAFLIHVFGDEYKDYTARVRRWL